MHTALGLDSVQNVKNLKFQKLFTINIFLELTTYRPVSDSPTVFSLARR